MTARRVVVLRDVGHLTAGDLDPLVAYLADPLDTTDLVLVAGGGRTPDALAKKLKEVKANGARAGRDQGDGRRARRSPSTRRG